MIKHLLNSVITKYRDLPSASASNFLAAGKSLCSTSLITVKYCTVKIASEKCFLFAVRRYPLSQRDRMKTMSTALTSVNCIFLQVYKEAQFYQIKGLIDTLERFSNVFAQKLEHARKSKLGSDFEKWQQQIITCAQSKSLENLTSTSKVSLLSLEDHKKIMECGDCVGPHAHNLVVSKPAKQGVIHHQETFDYVQRRFKETDLVICILTNAEMKMFISMTETDLKNNGYCCSFREEKIRCKNIKLHYGIGKEECRFNVTEHVVEFDW